MTEDLQKVKNLLLLRKINGEIIDTIVPECVNDNDYIDV